MFIEALNCVILLYTVCFILLYFECKDVLNFYDLKCLNTVFLFQNRSNKLIRFSRGAIICIRVALENI